MSTTCGCGETEAPNAARDGRSICLARGRAVYRVGIVALPPPWVDFELASRRTPLLSAEKFEKPETKFEKIEVREPLFDTSAVAGPDPRIEKVIHAVTGLTR